jgi:hypothetical protein
MGVFQLPVSLCKDINNMMQKFLWSRLAKTSKIHWMSWEKMGRAKSIGGLGFRDLIIFNKAHLAKQGWWILQQPHSIAAQILQEKYFPTMGFLEAPPGSQQSFAWRSLLNCRELLKQGLLWRVEDGRAIKKWGDKWLPTLTMFSVQSPPRILDANAKGAELIDVESCCWKTDQISAIFTEEESKEILNIPLSPCLLMGKLIWRGTSSGVFTVRSAYHLGKELQDNLGGRSLAGMKANGVWKTV